MTNLFENITNKLINKIEYLSTQIQDYFHVNTLLNNINYIDDETNNESLYTRNYLRNEVFPVLFKKWPNLLNTLISSSLKFSSGLLHFSKNL